MAARHEEWCYEKSILKHFHACKYLSNDDVGAARGTVFQEIRAGAGLETVDFVKEKLGGATVVRLMECLSVVKCTCVKVRYLLTPVGCDRGIIRYTFIWR